MIHLSMVIDDLYVDRPWRALGPFEANPPLVIDANAVLAFPFGPARLQDQVVVMSTDAQ